ncbi:MAG: arsenate reductase family protein [Verrucomicrobiales bacterium]|nr:arsenate reductase family protein [Verrucomicrobiales bacterium]
MKTLKVYTYEGCDTCRKALKFLNERKIAHEVIPIREQPPTLAELKAMLERYDGNLRKLFNTSGLDYKALNIKDTLPGMSPTEALKLLASNGRLVKRPFVVGANVGMVGFDAEVWHKVL